MSFGITAEGFVPKRLADIKEEIENDLRARLGDSINLVAPSVFSQLVGIQAEREALLWELAEDTYNSAYPDTAEGAALDNVVAISGLTRLGATFSTLDTVYLFGTNATSVPAGTILSVDGNPTARFITDTTVVLGAGTDEVQDIDFDLVPTSGSFKLSYNGEDTGLIAWNAAASAVQTALQLLTGLETVTVSGNFTSGFTVTFTGASSGLRPHALLTSLTNTLLATATPVVITIVETTPGVAQGTATCTAETAGEVQGLARTLTVIETPVSGLDSVINPNDATLGRDVESDLELRTRRAESLQIAGAATVEAIKSRVRNLLGVTAVTVIENSTDAVDGDGRPPHSFEVIVLGGTDAEIAEEIWQAKAAGIATFGNDSEVVVDSQGISHTIYFSRPTPVPIYIEIDLTTDSNYPASGDDLVKEYLVTRGTDSFGPGDDVVPIPTLIGVLDGIPGIIDAEIRVGIAPNPTLDNNITIDINEVATFDTANVVVGTI